MARLDRCDDVFGSLRQHNRQREFPESRQPVRTEHRQLGRLGQQPVPEARLAQPPDNFRHTWIYTGSAVVLGVVEGEPARRRALLLFLESVRLRPATSAPALYLDQLVKRYPTGIEALKGVSLTIEPGEFFGLLGPNGAGKSTLIHCTTGLAQPTSGKIEIFGHDAINDYGEARQAVGLAPQEINLDMFLTVEETLDFHGGYFGMPKPTGASAPPSCSRPSR